MYIYIYIYMHKHNLQHRCLIIYKHVCMSSCVCVHVSVLFINNIISYFRKEIKRKACITIDLVYFNVIHKLTLFQILLYIYFSLF